MKSKREWILSATLGCLVLLAIGVSYYAAGIRKTETAKEPESTKATILEETKEKQTVEKNQISQKEEKTKEISLEESGEKERTEEEPEKENSQKEEQKEETGSFQASKEDSLSFREEVGLGWPITGEVLLPYTDDGVVYYKTLNQYKYNPAVVIAGKVGDPVYAVAECVICKIEDRDETGLTLVTSIGSDYQVLYGQMGDLTVATGDLVEEGSILGYLGEPTGFYTAEGPNLWLQVTRKGETVNPLFLLR